jgi:hypothetical protein
MIRIGRPPPCPTSSWDDRMVGQCVGRRWACCDPDSHIILAADGGDLRRIFWRRWPTLAGPTRTTMRAARRSIAISAWSQPSAREIQRSTRKRILRRSPSRWIVETITDEDVWVGVMMAEDTGSPPTGAVRPVGPDRRPGGRGRLLIPSPLCRSPRSPRHAGSSSRRGSLFGVGAYKAARTAGVQSAAAWRWR